MVFVIQQHESKSLSFNVNENPSQSLANNDSSEVSLWPVVSMYDSFVPWLSPQILASSHSREQSLQQQQQRPKPSLSWLSRLFRKREQNGISQKAQQQEEERTNSSDDENCNDALYFNGTPTFDPLDENQYHRASLRFPPQAHSLARFHLSCIQTKRHLLNVGRVAHHHHHHHPKEASADSNSNYKRSSPLFTSTCASLEVGTLIDFFHPASHLSSPPPRDSESIRVTDTSDKASLLEDLSRQSTARMTGSSGLRLLSRPQMVQPYLPWHPSHIRVAAIGNYCRCVSWGFDNGNVTVYKNINESWTTVALVTPSTQVLSNEYSHIILGPDIAAKQKIIQCPSLNRVSDIVPLIVPTFDGKSAIALIILCRIGGCIEIHPLPPNVWIPNTDECNAKDSNSKQQRPVVTRLSSDSGAVIDPRQYHSDTTCIDVHLRDLFLTRHTSVYGNHPPVRFTIAASGTSSCGSDTAFSHPVVSLWTVEMILTSETSQRQKEDVAISSIQSQLLRVFSPFNSNDDSNYQLQSISSSLLRKCRVVAETFLLKRYLASFTANNKNNNSLTAISDSTEDDGDRRGRKHQCMEPLIEFTAPYIQLQLSQSFLHQNSKSDDRYREDHLLVSALDYYGTMSLFHFNYEFYTADRFELVCTSSLAYRSAFSQFQWLPDLPGNEKEHKNEEIIFLTGVSQSGLLTIAKLEAGAAGDDSINRSTRRLKVVFREEPNVASKDPFAISNPGTGTFLCRSQGIPFVRCLITKCLQDRAEQNIKGSILCSICSVQQLKPDIIAKKLECRETNREAISLLDKYLNSNDYCSTVLDKDAFYKALWEARTRAGIGKLSQEPLHTDDVEKYLCPIQDNNYVIRASVFEYCNISNPSVLRAILREGLGRLMRLQKESLTREEQGEFLQNEEHRESLDLIERRVVCLGTYEWFCHHLGVDFQCSVFFAQFMKSNMLSIANECALKGDIDALFVIFLRHGPETLPYRLELLSSLPPTLCPSSYSHLLPAIPSAPSFAESTLKGAVDFFLMEPNSAPVDLRHLILNFDSFLPTVKINVSDIASIESAHRFIPVVPLDSQILADWYVVQVLKLEKNGGSLKNALQLCQCGLERLPSQEGRKVISLETVRLESLSAALMHLDLCCNYGVIPETMRFSNWHSLEVASAIRLILGDETDPALAFSRWEVCIRPMIQLCKNDFFLHEWGWRLSSDIADFQEEAEQAVASYVFFRCKQDMLHGLSLCLMFAHHSRASLRRSSRIIRSDEVLTKLIMDCIYHCHSFTSENVSKFIELCWDIYETLPAHQESEDSNSTQNALHLQIDLLERHLIATEISSHYFVPLPLQHFCSGDESAAFDIILKRMCKSMRERAIQQEEGEGVSLSWKEMTTRFAVDVNELQRKVFIDIDLSIIEESLFCLLLDDRKFLALKELYFALLHLQDFNGFLFELRNEAQRFVYMGQIETAEKIAKCFLFLFPKIEEDLSRTKSLKEALSIIHDRLGCTSITYDALKSQDPFDVIGSVLTQNPLAIVYGSEWGNQEYSKEQNQKLWNNFMTGTSFSDVSLPGHIIHRLAMLLGFSTELDEFCVNQLMIFCGIQAGLYGAAASIYITSLQSADNINQTDSQSGRDLSSTALLNAVLLVSATGYSDHYIRKELCVHTLTHLASTWNESNRAVSFNTSQYFSILVEQYAMLDPNQMRGSGCNFGTSTSSDEQRGSDIRQLTSNSKDAFSEFLVFKAADFVAKGAKSMVCQKLIEKDNLHHQCLDDKWTIPVIPHCLLDPMFHNLILDQEEFSELFTYLRFAVLNSFPGETMDCQTPQLVKSTVSVIGRRSFSLCISEAARLRDRKDWQTKRYIPSVDMKDAVQLAVCMLLESESDCSQIASELQDQLEEEVSTAMKLAADCDSDIVPDEGIVRQLLHYGYSLNGARRATIATESSNFGAALSFAIAHCQDRDFDSPIFNIQNHHLFKSPSYVDQVLVRQIRDSLQFLFYMDLQQAQSSCRNSAFFSKLYYSSRKVNTSSGIDNPIAASLSSLSLKREGKKVSQFELAEQRLATNQKHKIAFRVADNEDNRNSAGSGSIDQPPHQPLSLLKNPNSSPLKASSLLSNKSIHTEKSETSSLVPPKLIVRACVDTILSNDISVKNLGHEEKQRLAEQGRRLLEASRRAKISSQSPGVEWSKTNLSKNNQILSPADDQITVQEALPFDGIQPDIIKPHEEPMKQGSSGEELKREGWDFEEDW